MDASDEGVVVDDQKSAPAWLTPSAFWMPRHYPRSAWVTHAAFASWIVAALRPSSVVELGTHYGFSCFAFAEAARRLGLTTRVFALDTWEGDDHAGFYEGDVYDYVRSIVDADYPNTVEMMRGLFAQSRTAFSDGSVDILHIDGRHGYEDVREDYEQWVSAVRAGGVVLFHDTAERRDDFGVWKLWGELAAPGRSFAFEHGHGLGVLAVGDPVDPSLAMLFEADVATQDQIREDFRSLGMLISHRAELEKLPQEVAALRRELEQAQQRLASSELRTLQANQEVHALKSSTSWRVTAPLRAAGRLRRRIK